VFSVPLWLKNDLTYKNLRYLGFGYSIDYKLENLVYLHLRRAGFDVYVGSVKGKEVDFVAIGGDRKIYVQVAYLLVNDETVEREYAPLEAITDNYEKYVMSLDDVIFPLAKGLNIFRCGIASYNLYGIFN
jgi:predicted AAA+ superfamily ATPase